MIAKSEIFSLVGYLSISDRHLTISVPAFRKRESKSTALYRQVPKIDALADRDVEPQIGSFERLPIGSVDRRFHPLNSKIVKAIGDSIVVVDENLSSEAIVCSSHFSYRETIRRILPHEFGIPPLIAYELALLTGDNKLIESKFRRVANSIGSYSSWLLQRWIDEQPIHYFDPDTVAKFRKADFSRVIKIDQSDNSPFSRLGFSGGQLRYYATGKTLEELGLFDEAAIINPTLRTLRPFTEFEKRRFGEDIAFLTLDDLEGKEWHSIINYMNRFLDASAQIVIVTMDAELELAIQRCLKSELVGKNQEKPDVSFLVLSDYIELAYLCRNAVSGEKMIESGILFKPQI